MTDTYDIAVIGAGIAGASLAAECAPFAKVAVIEAEDAPGYHTTGRSAAFWEETYGGPGIVPLTRASGPYLRGGRFLKDRGALYIGGKKDRAAIDDFVQLYEGSGVQLEMLDRDRLVERLPDLSERWDRGIWIPACADIDVSGLHQHYLRDFRTNAGALHLRCKVDAIGRDRGVWRLAGSNGEVLHATTIVNAAGAWADEIATLAGVRPLGISPLRRTVVQLRTAPSPPPGMPLVLDIAGQFYFKPEAGRLWLSPHDEEPSLPSDAAPEEEAVAHAIERFGQVLDWNVEAVERKWAGLRSFAPDRLPVFGFDPGVADFFWCAGQGGFGIQTAPAAARLCAQLLLHKPRDTMTRSLDTSLYDPARFRP